MCARLDLNWTQIIVKITNTIHALETDIILFRAEFYSSWFHEPRTEKNKKKKKS